MWNAKVTELATSYNGTVGNLPKYSSYGCYPIFYVDNQNSCVCADCANESKEDSIFDIVDYDVNYEDSNLYCDECSQRIESAYTEEEEEEYTDLEERLENILK